MLWHDITRYFSSSIVVCVCVQIKQIQQNFTIIEYSRWYACVHSIILCFSSLKNIFIIKISKFIGFIYNVEHVPYKHPYLAHRINTCFHSSELLNPVFLHTCSMFFSSVTCSVFIKRERKCVISNSCKSARGGTVKNYSILKYQTINHLKTLKKTNVI